MGVDVEIQHEAELQIDVFGVALDTLAGEKHGKGSSSVKLVPVVCSSAAGATCPNNVSSTHCSNEKVTYVTYRRQKLMNCVGQPILPAVWADRFRCLGETPQTRSGVAVSAFSADIKDFP